MQSTNSVLIATGLALTLSLGVATKVLLAQPNVQLQIDGSSTVYPISKTVAEEYARTGNQTQINVTFSGTGGGFRKFCQGEIDINNASRPITAQEMVACRQAGVAYAELPVAFDPLTVVVNPNNTWAKELTVGELRKIWDPAAQGRISRWSQVRPGWPERPLKLYGPDKDSGTYDYFVEAVLGRAGNSRSDYTASADDDDLVRGVSQNPNALGYFGYAYYEANQGKLKALAIDNGKGPVPPTRQNVETARYQPLARPLFLYVNVRAAQNKPQLRDFVEYYLRNAYRFVAQAGYVPLPETGYRVALGNFFKGKVGTIFGGRNITNLTLQELLTREAEVVPATSPPG